MGALEDDENNPDPALVGSRASDGNWLSVREAYRVFATKEQLEAMGATLKLVASRVDALPTTRELEARWRAEDERYTRIDGWLVKVDGNVDHINARAWVLPTLAIVVPIILVIVTFLLVKH